jgi:hypothetical protein
MPAKSLCFVKLGWKLHRLKFAKYLKVLGPNTCQLILCLYFPILEELEEFLELFAILSKLMLHHLGFGFCQRK